MLLSSHLPGLSRVLVPSALRYLLYRCPELSPQRCTPLHSPRVCKHSSLWVLIFPTPPHPLPMQLHYGSSERDVSLAARLLPMLAPHLPPMHAALGDVPGAACALVAALLQGEGAAAESASAPGGMGGSSAPTPTPLPVRVLQLGYQLFLAHEHAPLVGLTRLAQAATASLPHETGQLQDVSVAHQVRGG